METLAQYPSLVNEITYLKLHYSPDSDLPCLRVISYGIYDAKVECLQNYCPYKAGPVGPNVIASSMQMGLDK